MTPKYKFTEAMTCPGCTLAFFRRNSRQRYCTPACSRLFGRGISPQTTASPIQPSAGQHVRQAMRHAAQVTARKEQTL